MREYFGLNLRNVFVPRYIRFSYGTDEWVGQIVEIIKAEGKETPFFLFDEIFEKLREFGPLREKLVGTFPSSRQAVSRTDEMNYSDGLTTAMIEKGSDIVVAIGGGKCLDMGKYSAFKANLPFISSPTQTSHDGICSPRAVLKLNSSAYSLAARTPMAIVVDINTIRDSPDRKIRSGIGDLVSNIVAVRDWQLGRDEKGDTYDNLAAMISTFAAESLFCGGRIEIKDPKFLEKFVHGLIFSGIAMEIAGSSRPCSGAGHKISHALDKLGCSAEAAHGEQVALGALVACVLHGMDWKKMREFLLQVSLPVKCSDINVTREDFLKALRLSPSIRPERYTILDKLLLDENGYKEILEPAHILE